MEVKNGIIIDGVLHEMETNENINRGKVTNIEIEEETK